MSDVVWCWAKTENFEFLNWAEHCVITNIWNWFTLKVPSAYLYACNCPQIFIALTYYIWIKKNIQNTRRMCCITGLGRRVSLTALGCKSISNRGDERAFCLLRYSIKRISCLQLFPRHSRSCLESKPTFPPSTPKAKMYNSNVVVSSLFLRGGGGGGLFLKPLLRRCSSELNIILLC